MSATSPRPDVSRKNSIERQFRATLLRQRLMMVAAILIVLVPISMGAWWMQAGVQMRQRMDVGDAPVQRALGEIAQVTYLKTGCTVLVRVNRVDRPLPNTSDTCPAVRVGDPFLVEYQVGKSGRTYVLRILPSEKGT